jgi:hypothetical protein
MFPSVQAGRLLLYRLLDVADDIDLHGAEEALRARGDASRPSTAASGLLGERDLPLTLDVGRRTVTLEGLTLDVDVRVRVFAHGVVSVRCELPLAQGSRAADIASLLRRTTDSGALEQEARREVADLLPKIAPAVHVPHADATMETYAVVFATEIESGRSANEMDGEDLARILLAEAPDTALSEQTVAHATRHRFAYGRSDLCVLDWDAAFVLEPSADASVADVLEVATAQLLELRHYDAVFEREILTVAEELGRRRRRPPWRTAKAYRALARRVQRLVVQSAEVVERTENAVRFAGDLYLARVHRAAVDRFRIGVWQASVLRRQQTAADVAGLLHSDATSQLGHVLEGSILVLILVEIALALLRAA